MTHDAFRSEIAVDGTEKPSQKALPPLRKIGFVGLGHMGSAMAANLATAGYDVTGFVRHPGQLEWLGMLGVKPTLALSDLFDSDVVISMLPDDAAVRSVVLGPQGLSQGMKVGAIHLSMSTISTAAAAGLAKEHAVRGQGYVAAPVFGNPDAARQRQLFVIAAGAPADVERCRPLLEALGQQVFVIGTDSAQANLIKLLGNMMTATTLEIFAETITVMRRRGIDPKPFVDIMTGTMFAGRTHRTYGDRILHQAYAPGFAMPLALKDVQLALAEGEKAGAAMPSVKVVRDRMILGIARGHEDLDWSALGLISDEEAAFNDGRPSALV
jgi:3-hydroxyisobutyrate dehydrogenase-like beta-hydroxyacid dehydrogenase